VLHCIRERKVYTGIDLEGKEIYIGMVAVHLTM
jgi:cbb3-type cytochrome oxidase cytochrome c subunit